MRIRVEETPERRLWAIRNARLPNWFSAQRLPQRRCGTIEETIHPGALAASVVVPARWFAQRRLLGRLAWAAAADGKITALIARIEFPVQVHFDA